MFQLLKKYIDRRMGLMKMDAIEYSSDLLSSYVVYTFLALFSIICFLFFSIALGFFLSSLLNSLFYGFLIISFFYLFIILIFVFKIDSIKRFIFYNIINLTIKINGKNNKDEK